MSAGGAVCPCGAWAIWGALATPADVAAWTAEHAGHVAPPEATPSLLAEVLALGLGGTDDERGGVLLTFADAGAKRAAMGLLRGALDKRCTVAATELSVLARPRLVARAA